MLAPGDIHAPRSRLEPVVNLQLNFSDPGARSLGFGGAFIGLADDATAAFANPAGLVQLGRPEVSLEGRRTSYSTPFTEGGRVEGEPSGFGIDDTVGLRTARSDNVVSGLSFLSVAYPRGKWSVAFFRHQLADFELFTETQGLFAGGTNCCQQRFFDYRTSNDFDFVNYGLSGAFRVTETLNLGMGVTYLDASLIAVTHTFWVDDDSVAAVFQAKLLLAGARDLPGDCHDRRQRLGPDRWLSLDGLAGMEDRRRLPAGTAGRGRRSIASWGPGRIRSAAWRSSRARTGNRGRVPPRSLGWDSPTGLPVSV